MAAKIGEYPYSDYIIYEIFNKLEGRKMVVLVKKDKKHRTTMSYARYLMSIHLGRVLLSSEHVDHIDNNKTNDNIQNLQILTCSENVKKSKQPRVLQTLICPVCGNSFKLEKRQMHKTSEQSCSRRCGGIKSHWKKNR